MFKILCHCGACSIEIFDGEPKLSLFCGCEDCRQAIDWGAKNGGKPSALFAEPVYMKSDIAGVAGSDKMKAVKLRNDARSTRVYCKDCHAILGIDHPNYSNNVFMFFKNHCETSFTLPYEAVAAIYLDDLPAEARHVLPTAIPLFYSFPREREKFRSIEAVSNTFREPDNPPRGYSFGDLIRSLGEIEVLQLEQGRPV